MNIRQINIVLTVFIVLVVTPSFIFTQTILLSGRTYFGTVKSKDKFAASPSMKAYETIVV